MKNIIKRIGSFVRRFVATANETQMLALGRLLAESVKQKGRIKSLEEVEFKIFSQWGDDGIIQWLVHSLNFSNKSFIEFGVSNYRESNTRFLMMNNNWSGFVMDGSSAHVRRIINSEYYWRYDLAASVAFIKKDNVNDLIGSWAAGRDIGILHIDVDGNDYWIWKEITVVRPLVVIMEYNSVFGCERAITVPYGENFIRNEKHYSFLYFGASLRALCELADEKGYAFIGCNSAGNNAFFVRRDGLNDIVEERSVEEGFVMSKFRESRNQAGDLNYLSGEQRAKEIIGMPVWNISSNCIEPF